MMKFKIGNTYGDGALKFEIVSRTSKTVTYNVIQHFGKSNESVRETKRAKVFNWEEKEVFYNHSVTVEA